MSRRLIRTKDLAGFRRAVSRHATAGPLSDIRRRAVILPSRAAVELLRQTLESQLDQHPGSMAVLPDLLTRDEWLTRWTLAIPGAPRLLSRVEREVLMASAARMTATRPRMNGAPFHVRPGLVAAMLDFYDELHRRQRTVGRLRHELIKELKAERGFDRGTESLIHQTLFLVATFLRYQRAVAASGAADEHLARQWLVGSAGVPHSHIVVAVADHPSDPRGLWPADFDVLGRRSDLTIDVIVTDELHDAGFRDRLERELPGIEECREPDEPWGPVLVRPAEATQWLSRDREEEMRDVARVIRVRSAATGHVAPTALVVQRPLPYLYLSRQVFEDAGIPWQALEALPLAAEPWAALLDLVLVVARTRGTRESVVALLRSPWLRFEVEGQAITLEEIGALDVVLTLRRATGGAATYVDEVARFIGSAQRRERAQAELARRPAVAAGAIASSLEGFHSATTAADQLETIASFLRAHERGPAPEAEWREASLRARGAVLGALDTLADALRRHDNHQRPVEDLVALIRHRLEDQTFAPARHHTGVHVVDAIAARFGEFEHVHLMGLVDTDWPERQRRNIFFTSGLLESLGWPQDADHASAQVAAFRDLTGLPSRSLHLHAFELDADAVVGLSPMLDLVTGMPDRVDTESTTRAVFDDEVLVVSRDWAGEARAALDPGVVSWVEARESRPTLDQREYKGQVDAVPPREYRVSRVDRYVSCPFKYFAESVLELPEDREEMAGLTPLERGTLLHDLFERFYREWQDAGFGRITPALLPEAVGRFTTLAETTLAGLPEADRVLERTRLLGSLVARGVAERVFELEAESDDEIAERLLEQKIVGPFEFPRLAGLVTSRIAINGKADRVDVLADGRLRVIDYKLGRMPDLDHSIQVATYAYAVQQQMEARDGRSHPIDSAAYLAFGDEYKLEGPVGGKASDPTAAVRARAEVFADVVARIEAGDFPPRPRDTGECEWCRYSGVCRKEYDWEDDAAEPV